MIFPDFVIPKSDACQRLFHGRGHAFTDLEHVCIDWYAPVILITLYKEVESPWLKEITERIQQNIPQARSIQVQYRCRKLAPVEVLFGEHIQQLQATELNLQYQINLANNQNHGLFLDMLNGREWVLNNSKQKRVLNLFAYTCAFSICAIAGQADFVLNLDMSKSALSQGRENHKLNHHDLERVKYVAVDLFKSWGKIRREPKFDLLICDPPSFQKGSVNIERDYKKIIKRIPEFMNANSELLLCLNSPDLNEEFLLNTVAEHCPDCVFQHKIANPEVFIEAQQGKGLKVLLFKYLPKQG